MSYVPETIRIINSESAVFSFLPAVNYVFYYSTKDNPSLETGVYAILSIVASALLYNLLTKADFSPLNHSDGNNNGGNGANARHGSPNRNRLLVLSLLIGLVWIIAFIRSIKNVYAILDTVPSAVLLLAVSVLFVSLLFADLLLAFLLRGLYD